MAHAHSRLSPSAAHRWVRCPGSVEAEKDAPNKDTEYSISGTLLHALAEHCISNNIWNPLSLVGQSMVLDSRYPALDIDAEGADIVRVYMDHVASLLLDADYVVHAVEQKVDMGAVVGRPDCWGTADFLAVVGTTLHVVDLKTGRGEIVHPDGNEQLILYAAGALAALPHGMRITHVTLTIVQPKTQRRPESHTYTLGEISAAIAMIREAALRVTPDAPRVAGEKQCRWCKARATCPATLELAHSKAVELFDGASLIATDAAPLQPVDPRALPDDRLAELLEAEAFIRQTLDACAEEAVRRITTGGSVRGFKMVAGRSSREWASDADDTKVAAALSLKEEDLYEMERLTPAGVEKLIPSKMKKALEPFVVRTAGKPTLAKESDKRPAIEYNAGRLFDATAVVDNGISFI